MRPADPRRPSIDPRTLLAEGGAVPLGSLLARAGYIVQRETLDVLAHALRSRLPWLVEGPRGGGKTALAEALAESCNLPLFYLQGMEGLGLADVLYDWDREGQTQWVRQALLAGESLGEARARQWSREFLLLGEALGAYDYAASHSPPPVLVCDEFDKVSEEVEDMLLQLFSRGHAHVPRFGEVGLRDLSRSPVVILLSNDQRRGVSSPMRSRCVYGWLPPPRATDEAAVLRARCPDAPSRLLAQTVKLARAVRALPGVVDKPGLRESITLLRALVDSGVGDLGPGEVESHLCFVAKRKGDLDNLRKSLARVDALLKLHDEDLDDADDEKV